VILLAAVTLLMGCGKAQLTPVPEPFPTPTPTPTPGNTLYLSPDRYSSLGVFDQYTVADTAHGRSIPVLVRYPRGTPAGVKLPIILWSHGGGLKEDARYSNVDWSTALASAGYIVVHMSHTPGTPEQINALALEFGVPLPAVGSEFQANVFRPRDAIATLNDLPQLENAIPDLKGKFDYDRVGMGGHSRGSYTVRSVECATVSIGAYPDYSFRDTRFLSSAALANNTPLSVVPKAYLANSPQGIGRFNFKSDSWRNCITPDLTQTGQGDTTPGEEAPARPDGYKAMPAGDKYLMFIADPNTPHETFNLNNPDQPLFQDYIRTTGTAFFDAYLKGYAAAKSYLKSGTLEGVSNNVATLSAK